MAISGISPSPPAEDPGLGLLKLMADPAALSAKIAAYEKAKSDADAAVALVGEANKIVSLRDEAKALRNEAKQIAESASAEAASAKAEAKASLNDAKKKSAEILEKAKLQHDEYVKQAKAVLDDAEKNRAEAVAYVAGIKSEAEDLYSSAKSIKDAADLEMQKALELAADAEAKKATFEKKIKALTALAKDD